MGDMQGELVQTWRGRLPANVEPVADFVQRADRWWKDTVVRYTASSLAAAVKGGSEGKPETEDREPGTSNVLVVSHGGWMHVLLQNLIESRRVSTAQGVDVGRYRFPNASVTVIEVEASGKGSLVLFADTTHLDVELVRADTNADDVEQ
jgi:2,3-bisphosphoglycerate-dependent phosphoglycerate mutase